MCAVAPSCWNQHNRLPISSSLMIAICCASYGCDKENWAHNTFSEQGAPRSCFFQMETSFMMCPMIFSGPNSVTFAFIYLVRWNQASSEKKVISKIFILSRINRVNHWQKTGCFSSSGRARERLLGDTLVPETIVWVDLDGSSRILL